jgi:LuxR family maltose regulon positive regulatory protein
LDKEFVHFALCVCQYEEFTQEMASYLTGNKQIGQIIEYCRGVMNQIEVKDGGYYMIRPAARGYFCWKQNLLWTEAEITENYRRAADYYEMHEDIPNALKYYRKAGATQRIKELLIRNANMHPGTGQYVETQEYYFELPDEEIKDSPVLMAGMSMLCDLILLPEKSEKWYHQLQLFFEDPQNSKEKRREAKTRLAYLDIALPHRGINGIMRIM